MNRPTVGVVVLGWQDEPWLADCVASIRASRDVEVDLVLVDNGITSAIGDLDVRVVRTSRNLGFAGGCNAGAAQVRGEFLALVNSDAVVRPETLRLMVDTASAPDVGIAGAGVRLAENPALINSAGNPVHLFGLCWAGRLGEPETGTTPVEVTTASGACLVLRRAVWDDLGGFDPEYFAYLEDAELSLRVWRRGLRVLYRPDAVALHHYEFSRNTTKLYLLERNRLMLVATMWSGRALAVLALPLLAFELAMVAVAARHGWLRQKVRGWGWLWTHRAHVRTRRRLLQGERTVPDEEWMARLTAELSTTVIALPAATGLLNAGLRVWWGVLGRLV